MKIVAKRKELTGGILGEGKHRVTIKSAEPCLSQENNQWADRTPQLKVVFENNNGVITHWFNLKGYKNSKDVNGIAGKGFAFKSFDENSEEFLCKIDAKTGKATRVASDERTEKLSENIANLAFCAGIDELDTDEPADLVGQEVGIDVRLNERGYSEVYFVMEADRVPASTEVEA